MSEVIFIFFDLLPDAVVKMNAVYYCYPLRFTVSFTLVARKHIEHLRMLGCKVYEVDESLLPVLAPVKKTPLVIHPLFYSMVKVLNSKRTVTGYSKQDYIEAWLSRFRSVTGIDVADSDRLSEKAVEVANLCNTCVVPSRFARNVYVASGVKVPVHAIPHGVDEHWYSLPSIWTSERRRDVDPNVAKLRETVEKEGLKVLLFWLWHSPDRKGWAEVKLAYRKLASERNDVILVLVTMQPAPRELMELADVGIINVYGFLDDLSKMALYDMAAATLVFSRGGGFELCALESLARGTPAFTVDWGPFPEYVPPEFRLKRGYRVEVLPNNEIHVGYGYTVDVDDAVEKLHRLLDDQESFRSKAMEWREKRLRDTFTWSRSVEKLRRLICES